MASEIRVNQIQNRSGLSTVTFSDTGVVISGVTTVGILSVTGNLNVTGSNALVVSAGSTAAPSISPSGDSNTGIFFPAADTVAIGEGGTEVLRVDSNGFVGIATNNPQTNLHIGGATDKSIRINTSTNNSGFFGVYQDTAQVTVNRDGANGSFVNVNKSAATIILSGESGGSYISFATAAANNTSPSERVRLTSAGNLGIGLTNPTSTLDVGGEVTIRRTAPGSEGGQLNLSRASDNASAWYLDVYGSTSTPDLRFVDATAAAVRMQIDSNGRVTTPAQPMFAAYRGSNQSITAATATKVFLDATEFNIGSTFDTSTSRFTAPVTGTYLFTAAIQYGTTGSPHSNFWKNGATFVDGWLDFGTSTQSSSQSRSMYLNAGDYIELYGYHTANTTMVANRTRMTGFLIG